MKEILAKIARTYGPQIEVGSTGLHGGTLLLAIADVESGDRNANGMVIPGSGGLRNVPVHEGAYDFGGYYWRRASHVRDVVERWGAWAACSYSPWQLLFVAAWELGLRHEPGILIDPVLAAPWVVKMLNQRLFDRGAKTVRDVADGWNSGSFKDANVPQEYIDNLETAYFFHNLSGSPNK